MKWTPELDNRIADLLRAKKTASQIGAEMGVSRNAIIGRVTRCAMLRQIGFARKARQHRLPSISVAATRKQGGVRGGKVSLNRLKPIPVKPKAPAPVQHRTEPHHVGRPLAMLPACRCKFAITPHNAPRDGHLFCGEITESGKSWCVWHEQIVWGRGTAGETATVKSAERIAA